MEKKQELLRLLTEQFRGKDMNLAFPELLAAYQKLKQENISFTKEEIDQLLKEYDGSLSEKEKGLIHALRLLS